MKMKNEIYLAPAKLNLFLHVVGRKANGYHLLQSLFTKINVYDELQINISQSDSGKNIIKVNTVPEIVNLKESDNLCYKAAEQILLYNNINNSNNNKNSQKFLITINLKKNIPNGAGLGGGSSDAAMVLKILNNKLHLHLSENILLQIAQNLGADVPFFIKENKHYFVEGIGEQLTEISNNKANEILNNMYYLILKDDSIVIPTPMIYKDENLQRNSPKIDLVNIENDISNNNFFANKNNKNIYKNNLESVAMNLFPKLNSLKTYIQNNINENIKMTGSGSAMFIASDNKSQLENLLTLIENAENSKKISKISWKIIAKSA